MNIFKILTMILIITIIQGCSFPVKFKVFGPHLGVGYSKDEKGKREVELEVKEEAYEYIGEVLDKEKQ